MISALNYSKGLFGFERDHDSDGFRAWLFQNWTMSFVFAAVYVVVIFGIRHFMKRKERFELRTPLVLWSGSLALFSIAGAVRTLPHLITVIQEESVYQLVCVTSAYEKKATVFWGFAFIVSKVYELGDTIFIVLRKQPLIFLHWYHHVSVMLYVWYSFPYRPANHVWYFIMNYIVHAFMYTHYTMKALRVQVPRWISMFITVMQIVQMVIGIFVTLASWRMMSLGLYCQQSYDILFYGLIMYASYFSLFVYYFYSAYMKPNTSEKANGLKPNTKETTNGLKPNTKEATNGQEPKSNENNNGLKQRKTKRPTDTF